MGKKTKAEKPEAYARTSVPDAASSFARPRSLVPHWRRANVQTPSFPEWFFWIGLQYPARLFLPLLEQCPGQLAGHCGHVEKSGQLLLFLNITLLCTLCCAPTRGGYDWLDVFWEQFSACLLAQSKFIYCLCFPSCTRI